MRRFAAIALAVVAGWLVLLVVLDVALAGREARHVRDRLGETLHAQASVGDTDLALVRGDLVLDHLAVRRDDPVGHLALDVSQIGCDLPPLGWALVDSSCRELRVDGTRLDVSAAALFQIEHREHGPIRADRVVIDDAELAFAPSAFLPDLGKITIAIEHAEAGPTVFRTPLSWLLSLEVLRARIDLPAGISVRLEVQDGTLRASGALFGSAPVELPVQLPAASAARDAHEELALLVQTGEDIATRLVEKRAVDWMQGKLRGH